MTYSRISGEELAIALKYLERQANFSSLKLLNCKFENKETLLLSKVVKESKTLEHLSLKHSEIEKQGVEKLVEAIRECETLNRFSFPSKFVEYGGDMFLFCMKKKEWVDMEIEMEKGKEGEVLEILNKIEGLKVLSVSYGYFVETICSFVRKNKSVTCLEIYDWNMRNKGAKMVGEALKENKAITTLNIEDNSISTEGGIAFLECVEKNEVLREIEFGPEEHEDSEDSFENFIPEEILEKIKVKLGKNREEAERKRKVKIGMMILQKRKGNIVSSVPRRLLVHLLQFF